MNKQVPTPERRSKGSAGEVFAEALRLGLTSFGGPVAHLGYFERSYVRDKKWLSPEDYAGIVGLCQALPGPTSSQVGFLVGLQRAGWRGALAAFLGFTAPSALLMLGFALLTRNFTAGSAGGAFADTVHGLKLAAVAVVAQAVWSMARRHCPDSARGGLALGAMALGVTAAGTLTQLAALVLGAAGGLLWCRPPRPKAPLKDNTRKNAQAPAAKTRGALIPVYALLLFLLLLAGLPLLAAFAPYAGAFSPAPYSLTRLLDIFYRSGALVFGGGHVVLPLLRDALVPGGFISDNSFLTGYGFAQTLPGPLFAFASYLGARSAPSGMEAAWAALSTLFIFLPGLLVALAGAPLWRRLKDTPAAQSALLGVNAAVTGLLGAALYAPVWTSAVHDGADVMIAVTGLFLLERNLLPPILVVALSAVLSTVWRAAAVMVTAGS